MLRSSTHDSADESTGCRVSSSSLFMQEDLRCMRDSCRRQSRLPERFIRPLESPAGNWLAVFSQTNGILENCTLGRCGSGLLLRTVTPDFRWFPNLIRFSLCPIIQNQKQRNGGTQIAADAQKYRSDAKRSIILVRRGDITYSL